MFKVILKWSLRMVKIASRAVRRRVRENPRVQLIPVIDDSSNADQRKHEIQTILALMVANARKRGRPKKDVEEELPYAA